MDREQVLLVFLLLLSTVVFSHRTYIAWLRPKGHWKHLYYWSNFYAGWSRLGEEWWRSRTQFWILRIAYTLGFLISLVGLIVFSFELLIG
jgi:hypothetical protein